MSNDIEQMSSLRKSLFPIASKELKKFLPMAGIMMMILFNYTIMRDLKDALVVNHPISDAEVISFLKLALTTPASIIFVLIFTKMVNVFSSEKIFYIIVGFFLIFFALFGFVLQPYSDFFHPSMETVRALQEAAPRLSKVYAMWGMWTYSAFYVMAELWGTSMISLLFYKFANEIIKTEEAKRFYPMFILCSNFALIISGSLISSVAKGNSGNPEAWSSTLRVLTILMLVAGLLAVALYRYMNTTVLTDPRYYNIEERKEKKSKPKMGMGESFAYIFSSPYLMYLAVLVIAYGASIHIVEVAWKKSLKLYAGSPNKYTEYMGYYSASTGLITIILAMLMKGVVARFGWFIGAIITPLMIGGTGVIFLLLFLLDENLSPLFAMFGTSALAAATLIGAIQGILSKATKYSLFDPTKEMAYIPLDDEIKAKGKASVDVIGSRLGKSSGSVLLIALYSVTGISDIKNLIPIVLIMLTVIILAWIFAVFGLNKRYNNLIKAREAEKKQVVINSHSKTSEGTPKGGETNFTNGYDKDNS